MRFKRFIGMLLVCAATFGCLGVTAGAQSTEVVRLSEMAHIPLAVTGPTYLDKGFDSRASNTLNLSVPANSVATADKSFSLEAGETVTINCSYSPASASMDFGLVAPDGYFYYINVTSGSINKTIQVEERGTYTLAVMNNSSSKVTVIGTVKY